MKVVNGWMMEGHRPGTPEWDGTGKHPILGMTMEEIRAHAKASAVNYVPRADSDVKAKKMTPEEEQTFMEISAKERWEAHQKALSESLTHR